ncbi:hypothetical protein BESB_029980 [Besnoitia besnoiti]|uniref:Dense granule protein GRA12 n=1 Tax=Besnoitia besnoiti TaxID=94643 RepID=A0A2A9M1K6_BESBE|nr:hypothetical protein BESB_029980 [Besnoitia besnoiti]PFH31124.1 hypothetical protein BESB_029980 [Besnoitia besnoiti]
MGFLARMGGAVFARSVLYAAVAWVGVVSISHVSAEVGLLLGGINKEFVMESRGHNWSMDAGACFVGRPRHLVVDPTLDHDFMRTQELITNYTGPRLCAWLENTYTEHMAQKKAWEAEHQKSKSSVSVFNVLKKLKKAVASFPVFTVTVTVRYFDLWHDDRWGNPLPWIMARFEYTLPENGYGLFSHISPVFSMNPSSGTAAVVHILLSPPPTFNQYVDLGKEKAILLSALASGTGVGHAILAGDKKSPVVQVFQLGQLIYALAENVLTMKFAIGDFWLKGTECYILSRLAVTTLINGVPLCQFVANRGGRGLWALYKAEKRKSVAVSVTAVDFFNYRRPTFQAIVTEGLIFGGVNDAPVVMELVTDPTVIPKYVGTVKAARKVRWTVSLLKFFHFVAETGMAVYDAKEEVARRREMSRILAASRGELGAR